MVIPVVLVLKVSREIPVFQVRLTGIDEKRRDGRNEKSSSLHPERFCSPF